LYPPLASDDQSLLVLETVSFSGYFLYKSYANCLSIVECVHEVLDLNHSFHRSDFVVSIILPVPLKTHCSRLLVSTGSVKEKFGKSKECNVKMVVVAVKVASSSSFWT